MSSWGFDIVTGVILVILFLGGLFFLGRRPQYERPKAFFEGGGIRRGLTPPEACVILEKPFSMTRGVVLIQLLDKGFIEIGQYMPVVVRVAKQLRMRNKVLGFEQKMEMRLAGAKTMGHVLYPYEDQFLELLEQNEGKRLEEINFEMVTPSLKDYADWRVSGYDLEATKEYLESWIDRALKEVRLDGELVTEKKKVWQHNFLWIVLGKSGKEIPEVPYLPLWWEGEVDFQDWLSEIGVLEEGLD